MGIEVYFAISALLLLLVSLITFYKISVGTIDRREIFFLMLQILTVASILLFTFKFSIYKHICILKNIGLNLLNIVFLGTTISLFTSIIFNLRFLFALLSPLFLVLYIVGFIKSLNILPHNTPNYTILTYLHIFFFSSGIITNLIALLLYSLKKYLYFSLQKKNWSNLTLINSSIEKINRLAFVFLIATFIMFFLGFLTGTYSVIETKKFQYFLDPLSLGSMVAGGLLVISYLCTTYSINWLTPLTTTVISNLIIFFSYFITILFKLKTHY